MKDRKSCDRNRDQKILLDSQIYIYIHTRQNKFYDVLKDHMTRACLYRQDHINIVGYTVANWAGDAIDKVVKIEIHCRIGRRCKIVNHVVVTRILSSYQIHKFIYYLHKRQNE